MSDACFEYYHDDSRPEVTPGFALVPKSPEHLGPPKAVFDPEQPISEVNIKYFTKAKNEDIVRNDFGRDLVRFMTETAEGYLADEKFNELFGRTVTIMLEGVIAKQSFRTGEEPADQTAIFRRTRRAG